MLISIYVFISTVSFLAKLKGISSNVKTLQPIDSLVNPHKRDNKKIILPFLKENQKELMGLWQLYMDGYTSPEITQEGQQFYAES